MVNQFLVFTIFRILRPDESIENGVGRIGQSPEAGAEYLNAIETVTREVGARYKSLFLLILLSIPNFCLFSCCLSLLWDPAVVLPPRTSTRNTCDRVSDK